MLIKKFIHNDEQKRELFGWIGEACASVEVRNELGAPITSKSGDIWLLALEGTSLVGFCAVTILKSRKAAKLHAFYSNLTKRASMVESKLISAAEKAAFENGANSISVVDYAERKRVFEIQGWKVEAERGKQYLEFGKDLEG